MKMVYIGSDHAGLAMKTALKEFLRKLDYQVEDMGTNSQASCDYPVFAADVCRKVLKRGVFGILICGTGLGMSMAANRFPGIRAALCANEYTARMSRAHNDANVLCLGSRVTGQGLAEAVTTAFLETPFEGERHLRRIEMIDKMASGGE